MECLRPGLVLEPGHARGTVAVKPQLDHLLHGLNQVHALCHLDRAPVDHPLDRVHQQGIPELGTHQPPPGTARVAVGT
jgi:hypothetical protein